MSISEDEAEKVYPTEYWNDGSGCKKWDGIESDCVAKDEDDAWDYAGEICGYQEDFIDRAKEDSKWRGRR